MEREFELLINSFETIHEDLKGKRVALFEGIYLETVIDFFDPIFDFAFIISAERKSGGRTVNLKDLDVKGLDAVILTDHRSFLEEDYHSVSEICRKEGVKIYDLFGIDMIEIHDELAATGYMNLYQWKEKVKNYDVISFTIIHTFMNEENLFPGTFSPNIVFLELYRWLENQGKKVCFFWRKPFGEENQKRMLSDAGVDSSAGFILRKNRDLGYSLLSEMYPGRKILHIGNSFTEDMLIPRYYGIDSCLYRFGKLEKKKDRKEIKRSRKTLPSKDELIRLIDSHDVISFDMFDTLLMRPLHEPDDLFSVIEDRENERDFRKRRKTCLEILNNPTVDEIYAAYEARFGVTEGAAVRLKTQEIRLERELLERRKSVGEIFDHAVKSGKRTVIVTDMHLTGDVLEEILEENGYEGVNRIYISSVYRKRKEEGLFDEVISDYPESSILHIGDDYYADFRCALDAGIDAFHVPSAGELSEDFGLHEAHELCTNADELLILGLAESLAFDNPFRRASDEELFSYLSFALMNAGYLSFVHDRLRGSCDMFLLSGRDGWPLLEGCEILKDRFGDFPEFRYFETSRHAAFLLAADDMNRVSYFDTFYRKPSLKTMLENVYGLKGKDYVLDEKLSLRDNLENNLELLEKIAKESREGLEKYLASLGVNRDDRICLMDFISSGTVLGMINSVTGRNIRGLFYARPQYQQTAGQNISTYIDENVGFDFSLLLDVEAFMTSDRPSLDRYASDGSRIDAEEVRSERMIETVCRVQRLSAGMIRYYLEKLYDGRCVINEALVRKMLELTMDLVPASVGYDDWIGEEI